ncbi:hypothetical protein RP20_CCG025877 [Aedes albopictus]|nr:histone H3-6-like [Aedes albopictus]KXJ80265.1 hypothetical protein RP20_CCG025877 [Aedes albopictus]
MPRRWGRQPTRNPQGLGTEEQPSDTSSDSGASNSPPAAASRQTRRRSSSAPARRSSRAQAPEPRAASAFRGTKALAEIRHLQRTTDMLIPKLPFARVIREVMLDYSGRNLRITAEALMAVQEAAEIYLVMLFEDCEKLALHRQRVTITKRDMDLAVYFRIH